MTVGSIREELSGENHQIDAPRVAEHGGAVYEMDTARINSRRAPRASREPKPVPPPEPEANVLDAIGQAMAAAMAPRAKSEPVFERPAVEGTPAQAALALLDRAEAADAEALRASRDRSRAENARQDKAARQAEAAARALYRACVLKAVVVMCAPVAERLAEVGQAYLANDLHNALLDIGKPGWRTDPEYGYEPPPDEEAAQDT